MFDGFTLNGSMVAREVNFLEMIFHHDGSAFRQSLSSPLGIQLSTPPAKRLIPCLPGKGSPDGHTRPFLSLQTKTATTLVTKFPSMDLDTVLKPDLANRFRTWSETCLSRFLGVQFAGRLVRTAWMRCGLVQTLARRLRIPRYLTMNRSTGSPP